MAERCRDPSFCTSVLVWGTGLALAAAAPSAAAQDTDAQRAALAEMLFNMGRDLLAEGDVPAACRKFESSLAVDHAAGTLLNLAVCHEQEGRIASAWAEFKESISLAAVMRDAERERLALEHIRSLEPLLPRVRILVSPEANIPGLALSRDGVVVPRESWGIAMPVDPGPVAVRAEAPGHVSHELRLQALRATTVDLVVPVLEPIPRAEPEEPAPARPAESSARGVLRLPREGAGSDRWVREAAWIGGGVGIVALAAGSYFGVRAIQKRRESDDYCPKGNLCYPEGVALIDEAGTAADRANGLFAAGALLVAAGATTLLLTWPEDPTGRPSAQVGLGPGGAHARVGWGF